MTRWDPPADLHEFREAAAGSAMSAAASRLSGEAVSKRLAKALIRAFACVAASKPLG